MKRIGKLLSVAAAAIVILGTTGCETIRDYSVNSYQGVMPVGDFRPSASANAPYMPNPSTPTPGPTASPNAAASGTATK